MWSLAGCPSAFIISEFSAPSTTPFGCTWTNASFTEEERHRVICYSDARDEACAAFWLSFISQGIEISSTATLRPSRFPIFLRMTRWGKKTKTTIIVCTFYRIIYLFRHNTGSHDEMKVQPRWLWGSVNWELRTGTVLLAEHKSICRLRQPPSEDVK